MAIIVSSSRRRLVMAILLVLATAGGVIRHQAPDPSTLRDVGTLLLVLWLPAVGNFVGYLKTKIPASRPPPLAFEPGLPFTPQLMARIEHVPLPAGWMDALDPAQELCTALVGRRGFTVRASKPVSRWLTDAPPALALECLVPPAALRALVPGTAFHLVVGATPVATGVVETVAPSPAASSRSPEKS